MNTRDIITIDGPAGSGKSTLALSLARAMGWAFLDTGAIYRAVAVAATDFNLPDNDPKAAGALVRALNLKVEPGPKGAHLFINDDEVTSRLRTPEISAKASLMASWPQVREALLGLQRRLAANGKIVAEGRDMGTVVFPEARLKIYLDASPEIRARRRHLEMVQIGLKVSYETVLAELKARDLADSSRDTAPLAIAQGALILETETLGPAEVLARLHDEAKKVFTDIY